MTGGARFSAAGPCPAPAKPRLLCAAFTLGRGGVTCHRHAAEWKQQPRQQEPPARSPWRRRRTPVAAAAAVQAELAPVLPLGSCNNSSSQLFWYDGSQLESVSRQQLQAVLSRLHEQRDLSAEQVELAHELAADLEMGQLAPDLVAAALLVLLARSEGRRLDAASAGRAVRRACGYGAGRYNSLVSQVRRLEAYWAGSERWQALLGPAVSPSQVKAAEVLRTLQRLAAGGPAAAVAWAPAAARAAAAVERWDGEEREGPGNLAGGLLVLVSSGAAGASRGGSSSSAASMAGLRLTASAAAHAVRAVGGDASPTGVAEAARRLECWRGRLGLPAAAAPVDPHPQRMAELEGLLGRLQAIGQLPAADVPLLLQLARSLGGVSWPAGTLAAALLVTVGRAHGAAGPGHGPAAAAVRQAGGKAHGHISFHLKHLLRHWEANEEWKALLGPPKGQAAVVLERLSALLHQLAGRGMLSSTQLATALALASDLRHSAILPHLVGSVAGALLVQMAAARGETLGKAAAAALVRAAGAEAGTKGITTQLARLQEHWEQSEKWRLALGDPPASAPWAPKQVSIADVLPPLAAAGHLEPAQATAAEQLVRRLGLPAAAHGNFAAAVLVAAAAARGGQGQLLIQEAVAEVKRAGGSASPGCAGRMLRRVLAGWKAGGEEWQGLLGPYCPPQSSDSLPLLEALLQHLAASGALTASQLPLAEQLGAALVERARQPWRAGSLAAAVLLVLAAAEGRQLTPAHVTEVVRAAGWEASTLDVVRHKNSALKLWQGSKRWQAQLGRPAVPPPPSRTTLCTLLHGLASKGQLPSSQLQPVLTLTRRLRVPREQAPAAVAAVVVGWVQAMGRQPDMEAVAAAAGEGEGAAPTVWEVQAQLTQLEERWGPPSCWLEALSQTQVAHQEHCWRQLSALLMAAEASGHLRPGQVAKVLYLAPTLQVWTGCGPAQKPGNVAAALLLVAARSASGRGGSGRALTGPQAVAAVRAAGGVAIASSTYKWCCRAMRLWRESPDWQAVLGEAPVDSHRRPAAARHKTASV